MRNSPLVVSGICRYSVDGVCRFSTAHQAFAFVGVVSLCKSVEVNRSVLRLVGDICSQERERERKR